MGAGQVLIASDLPDWSYPILTLEAAATIRRLVVFAMAIVGCDVLDELGRVGDRTLADVLVFERARSVRRRRLSPGRSGGCECSGSAGACRHPADETPHHGWAHSSTRAQKRPWKTRTVQHYRARPGIVRHT